MAVQDLAFFLTKVKEITGRDFDSEELFGVDATAWAALPESGRRTIFNSNIAGGGRGNSPVHPINQNHLLFMAHPINGLDDLVYVVHFGSFPYAVNEGGSRRRARIEEIFSEFDVEYLYCRNADPGAAAGAYSQVFLDQPRTPMGKEIAFGDPLGMYMRTFSVEDLDYNGAAPPESWVRWSRGDANGTAQRLEFGPSDDEPHFLDEVTIGTGSGSPAINGYQLAKRIEVGPLVMIAKTAREVKDNEFLDIEPASPGSVTCGLGKRSVKA